MKKLADLTRGVIAEITYEAQNELSFQELEAIFDKTDFEATPEVPIKRVSVIYGIRFLMAHYEREAFYLLPEQMQELEKALAEIRAIEHESGLLSDLYA